MRLDEKMTMEQRRVDLLLIFILVDSLFCSRPLTDSLGLGEPETCGQNKLSKIKLPKGVKKTTKKDKKHVKCCCYVESKTRECCTDLLQHGSVNQTIIIKLHDFAFQIEQLLHVMTVICRKQGVVSIE